MLVRRAALPGRYMGHLPSEQAPCPPAGAGAVNSAIRSRATPITDAALVVGPSNLSGTRATDLAGARAGMLDRVASEQPIEIWGPVSFCWARPRQVPALYDLDHRGFQDALGLYSGQPGGFIQDSRGRMRTFFVAYLMAVIIGVPLATGAIAHEGWFVRVCPAKTEANRVYMTFSGSRQGFSWSWIKGRTPDETDLPRRFRSVPRLHIRASTVSMPGNIQPHAYVCIGFRDHIVQRMEFDNHEDHQKSWNDTDDCAC